MPTAAPRLVVGAIIVNDLQHPTRVFAARRTSPPALAGLWEFPGGKTETGESPEEALVREVEEELTATITIGPELPHASGAWPISDKYAMRLFFAAVAHGTLTSGDSHDQMQWIAPDHLGEIDWLPSDRGAIESIQARLKAWPG